VTTSGSVLLTQVLNNLGLYDALRLPVHQAGKGSD